MKKMLAKFNLKIALCLVIALVSIFMFIFWQGAEKAQADSKANYSKYLPEIGLTLTGDHEPATPTDYSLTVEDGVYGLDLLTSGWDVSGTSIAQTLLYLEPNDAVYSLTDLDLTLGKGGVFIPKQNVNMTISINGNLKVTAFYQQPYYPAHIILEGSGKMFAKSLHFNQLTINGPEIYVSQGEDTSTLTIGAKLKLAKGKLIVENNSTQPTVPPYIGVLAQGLIEISPNTELFASAGTYAMAATVIEEFSSCNFVGSADKLEYSEKDKVNDNVSLVELSPNMYTPCLGGDINNPAKTIRITGTSPTPVPEPEVITSETAETGDVNAIMLICITIIGLASAGYVLSRKFRKN